MMEYSTFKAVAEKKILDYLLEEFKNAKVEITPVKKVNKTKDAITIREGESSRVSPNFYLDDMYEHYQDCGNLDEVFQSVADAYVANVKNMGNMSIPNVTREFVEENVIMVMINTESNEELLKGVPHREINDCSVIYRVVFGKDDQGIASAIVNDNIAATVDLSEQELFLKATENTKRILPTTIKPMSEVIMEMMIGDGMPKEIAEAMVSDVASQDELMWVISNTSGVNGAVNMLYDENLQKLAEQLQDDLYILPSSIHEVLCVPAGKGEPEEFAKMVQEVNMNVVDLEDRLSNQVYHYDKKLRKLTMATDEPNKRIDGIVAEPSLIYDTKEQMR